MMPRTVWFERKFMLDLPLSMYPNVLERVRGTPARLEDRLLKLPREALRRREGGNWSMQEQVSALARSGARIDLAPHRRFAATRHPASPPTSGIAGRTRPSQRRLNANET
jgi:hypothetical protein